MDYLLYIECPAGYYGPDCLTQCSCHPDASCDPQSGHCLCPPGKRGHDCAESKFFCLFVFWQTKETNNEILTDLNLYLCVCQHVRLVSGDIAASLDASARTTLWAVTQSAVSVCVRQVTADPTVTRVS